MEERISPPFPVQRRNELHKDEGEEESVLGVHQTSRISMCLDLGELIFLGETRRRRTTSSRGKDGFMAGQERGVVKGQTPGVLPLPC